MAEGRVIRQKIDPVQIAEEFIIQELIKMFPQANQEFYDKVRYYVREYTNNYNKDRFWRLVAGFSEGYMLKRHYRILKSDKYEWSLEEVPLKNIYVKMFNGTGILAKIMQEAGFNAQKAGEKLRKIEPKKRNEILDPFKFSKDNYPVILVEEDGKLIAHDGNRRSVDSAIFGMPTIQAYVGRIKNPEGKPAIPEFFFALLMSITKDTVIDDERKLFLSLATILSAFKKAYSTGPKYVDMYSKLYLLPFIRDENLKREIKKELEIK